MSDLPAKEELEEALKEFAKAGITIEELCENLRRAIRRQSFKDAQSDMDALRPTQARPDDGEVVEKPCKECGAAAYVWANDDNAPVCFGCYADAQPVPTADGGALPNAEEGDFDCPKAAASRSCPCGFCNALRRGAPKADVARLVEQLAQIRDRETTNIPDGQALTRAIEVLACVSAAQRESQ